ncbi:MAG: sulfatase-like hydrolase/transferase [Alphaproteobacteria bacterium]|nr:sulfatase-like hydrolase/transferase [Alphaproteobacteria bacterium]
MRWLPLLVWAACALPEPPADLPDPGSLPAVRGARGRVDVRDPPIDTAGWADAETDLPDDTAAGLHTDPPDETDLPAVPPNVMILLADDAGLDKIGVYDVTQSAPSTPTLDALAARGVRFQHAWAAPTCSPARATLLTGRHPFRHFIGRWIDTTTESTVLADTETTLPELLARAPVPYTSAVVGKWHLTGFRAPSPELHPLRMGFRHHRGSLANPRNAASGAPPGVRDYFRWEKNVDGQLTVSTTYMTTDTVDEAIALATTLPEPWFLFVSFNAPHLPHHVPPPPLPGSLLDASTASGPDLVDAAVEALDAEIGRLFSELGSERLDRTLVVFASDNGTDTEAIRPPLDPTRCKATVFEGGVRVPLIFAGPGVQAPPGSVVEAPVSLADLLPTVAAFAGMPRSALVDDAGQPLVLDGRSLRPHLDDPDLPDDGRMVWAEQFHPSGPPPQNGLRWTLRDRAYKLAEGPPGTLRLYHLEGRPFDEGPDLLQGALDTDDEAAMTRLETEATRLLRLGGRIP